MKQRTKTKTAILLSICIVAMIATAYVLTDRRDLLQRSDKVTTITGWAEYQPSSSPLEFDHLWLSNDTILFARGGRATEPYVYHFFRRNVVDNTEEEMHQLSASLHDVSAFHGIYPSPDAAWFVAPRARIEDADLVSVHSKRSYVLHPTIGRCFWLKDGHQFAFLDGNDKFSEAIIRDIDSPLKTRRVRLKTEIPFTPYWQIRDCGDHFSVLTLSEYPYEAKQMDVYETGFGIEPFREQKHRIPIPVEAELRECRLSPQGDRVAFLLYVEQQTLLETILRRFLPTFTQPKQQRIELWISGLKGDAHCLGVMRLPDTPDISRPYSMKWLPDGKRISYIYDNAIWIITADK